MIALVAAVAKNNVIGKSNDLPWYLPEDLKRFKHLTNGQVVIMGRKTYESILNRLGKPLPNRTNVVITANPSYSVEEGVEKFTSLPDAIAAHQNAEIFLIGGQRIFEEGINYADTMFLTELHKEYEGDVYFPKINNEKWNKSIEHDFPDFDFVRYTRKH